MSQPQEPEQAATDAAPEIKVPLSFSTDAEYKEWRKSLDDKAAAKGLLPYLQGAVRPFYCPGDVLQNAAHMDHWVERMHDARQIVLDGLSTSLCTAVWGGFDEFYESGESDESDLQLGWAHYILQDLDRFWDERMVEMAQDRIGYLGAMRVDNFSKVTEFIKAYDDQIKFIESSRRKLPDSKYASMFLAKLARMSWLNQRWADKMRKDEQGMPLTVKYADARAAALERFDENHEVPYEEVDIDAYYDSCYGT